MTRATFSDLKREAWPYAKADTEARIAAGEYLFPADRWTRELAACLAQTALHKGLTVREVAVSHGLAVELARAA